MIDWASRPENDIPHALSETAGENGPASVRHSANTGERVLRVCLIGLLPGRRIPTTIGVAVSKYRPESESDDAPLDRCMSLEPTLFRSKVGLP